MHVLDCEKQGISDSARRVKDWSLVQWSSEVDEKKFFSLWVGIF
jgi:hypothetical protein